MEEHSYEIPEILVVPVLKGSDGYFSWMEKELKEGAS